MAYYHSLLSHPVKAVIDRVYPKEDYYTLTAYGTANLYGLPVGICLRGAIDNDIKSPCDGGLVLLHQLRLCDVDKAGKHYGVWAVVDKISPLGDGDDLMVDSLAMLYERGFDEVNRPLVNYCKGLSLVMPSDDEIKQWVKAFCQKDSDIRAWAMRLPSMAIYADLALNNTVTSDCCKQFIDNVMANALDNTPLTAFDKHLIANYEMIDNDNLADVIENFQLWGIVGC